MLRSGVDMASRSGKFDSGGSRLSGFQVVGVDLPVPREEPQEVAFVLRG